jgi:glycosyltransferase involved in cell wall biosynthesis
MADTPPRTPGLSVFFPAYNDSGTIASLVITAVRVAATLTPDYEVIVVNDGSFDDTGQVLERLRGIYPKLRVITHTVNRGYGGALRSGFEAATRDYVFYTDGDGQYDVRELPVLLKLVRPNIGLVNGYKLERQDPWHRVWIGKTYNAFARALFHIQIRDIDCDYRLIRRDLLRHLGLSSTSGMICVELVRKLELSGCSTAETGVHHYPRLYGRSQFFRLRSLANTFAQLLRLYVRLVAAPAMRSLHQRASWSRAE